LLGGVDGGGGPREHVPDAGCDAADRALAGQRGGGGGDVGGGGVGGRGGGAHRRHAVHAAVVVHRIRGRVHRSGRGRVRRGGGSLDLLDRILKQLALVHLLLHAGGGVAELRGRQRGVVVRPVEGGAPVHRAEECRDRRVRCADGDREIGERRLRAG